MKVRVFGVLSALVGMDLTQDVAVVIDALRMTTVAVTAVANGCAGILAVQDVEQARAEAKRHGALLGGERGALRIEGFDFANSPLEYTAERVRGQRIVMTTSNGTRAILAASGAKERLLGGFVNAQAIAEAVRRAERVSFICAGTHGAFTLEDALAAGAMIERLLSREEDVSLDDMALAALRLYRAARPDLLAALCATEHFQRLQRLGMMDDLRYCLREDILTAVPRVGEDGWIKGAC